MKKNDLLKSNDTIIRVLSVKEDAVLVIDCIKRTMPKWFTTAALKGYEDCSEAELCEKTDMILFDAEVLDAESKRFVYEHYTLIAGILPFVGDKKLRNQLIRTVSEEKNISKRTIGNYLCLYLVYQNLSAFTPKPKADDRPLSVDEKNFRYALNKWFYNKNQNSLNTAYTMMLREKYCDAVGVLLPDYPSFDRFKYFYRKHKNLQTYYISRDGLKDYQRNNRPLLGNGIQEYASHVGMCMLDATVCDIYLVNEAGGLVGRPILVIAVDGYSSMVCGYSLLWEGGVYSLRRLMLNIIADKTEHCKRFGINIKKS